MWVTIMNLPEAQNIAMRLVNLKSDKITLWEIKQALVILGNFYEDYKSYIEVENYNSKKAEKCL
jgi:hypothetical protein